MYTLTHPRQCPLLTALSHNLIVIIPAAPHSVYTLPLPLLPLPRNHSEGLKHTFMELPSVHIIYGCMRNVQTILQHQEVNRAASVFETNSFKLLQDFFFAQKLRWSIVSTKLETCYMLHTACVGLVFVHNFHQNISSLQHISLLQGEMGKRSFSVTCHNKHMRNMNEHEARETTYLAHSLKAGGI